MQYRTLLRLAPLPLEARSSAILSRHHASAIAAAGGRAQAARAAAAAVLALGVDEPPSELHRLQRLYAAVYTREELERLTLDSFDALGLGD